MYNKEQFKELEYILDKNPLNGIYNLEKSQEAKAINYVFNFFKIVGLINLNYNQYHYSNKKINGKIEETKGLNIIKELSSKYKKFLCYRALGYNNMDATFKTYSNIFLDSLANHETLYLTGYTESYWDNEVYKQSNTIVEDRSSFGALFCINGYIFMICEDPDDGYRSYCNDPICIGKGSIKNSFNPIEVKLNRYYNIREHDELVDINDNIIIQWGTDYTDNYYPCGFLNFNIENIQK